MTDAVKAYREAVHDDTLTKWDIMGYADAAIAELEAEMERLRCCGNCASWKHGDYTRRRCEQEDTKFYVEELRGKNQPFAEDHCHFTPSRWRPQEEES
jgi:hypothetical protein